MGLPYWSLSALLKHKVKNAVEYISPLRRDRGRARRAARGVDGVVCGHIHHAEIRQIGGVLYLNDGDWVESCSALVEDAQRKYGDSSLGRSFTETARKGRQAAPPPRSRSASSPGCTRVGPGACRPGPIPGVAAHLKILIVTDAWAPQVNGVVRTLEILGKDLAALGHTVRYITPAGPAHLSHAHLSGNPAGAFSSAGD